MYKNRNSADNPGGPRLFYCAYTDGQDGGLVLGSW